MVSTEYLHQYFNSHPHEEDDKAGTYPATYTLYFNSHPHEEDDGKRSVPDLWIGISTHILTKRMTTLTLQAQRLTKHFNSHPHEEDDGELIDFSTITDISTHILTKRMTIIRQIISWILNISTHILTKRMTTKETTLKTTNLFQLTSSRRG